MEEKRIKKNLNKVGYDISPVTVTAIDKKNQKSSKIKYGLNVKKQLKQSEDKGIHIENEEQIEKKAKKDSASIEDYYKKYGINKNADWEEIKKKLSKESKMWMRRQSTTYSKEVSEEISRKLESLDLALKIFNPKNNSRLDYDTRLNNSQEEQKSKLNQGFPKANVGTKLSMSKIVSGALRGSKSANLESIKKVNRAPSITEQTKEKE